MAEVSEEIKDKELDEKVEEECEACDLALTIATITASCELVPNDKKEQCWQLITPLEEKVEGKKKEEVEPEKVLAQLIKDYGVETVEKSIKRLQTLFKKAKELAGIKDEEEIEKKAEKVEEVEGKQEEEKKKIEL